MIIKLENIMKSSKKYQTGIFSINDINLSFELGKIYNIVGNFESGNKDLLLIIGLIDNFSGGNYFLDNKNINNLKNIEKDNVRLKYLGIVLENPLFIDTLTILENIILPLKFNKNISNEDKITKVQKLLIKYNLLDIMNMYPVNLTYYQKQVISLIRALINNPSIIIIQNIFDNMNDLEKDNIWSYLKEYKKDNKTIIISSTNKLDNKLVDETIYMEKGRIIEDVN